MLCLLCAILASLYVFKDLLLEQKNLTIIRLILFDNHRFISMQEFKSILESHQDVHESDIEHLFQNIDVGNSNTIQYHEFIAAALSRQTISESNLKVAFDVLSNRSGKISRENIQDMIGSDGVSRGQSMRDIMSELDVPEEGIDFPQFKVLMKGEAMVSSPSFKNRNKIALQSF